MKSTTAAPNATEAEEQSVVFHKQDNADIYLRGTDYMDRLENEVPFLLGFRKAHLAEASTFFRNMFADATADEQASEGVPCIDVTEGATW